ncbi:MAG: Holliday junction resolvase RuvX [Lachnospiraceae bacterium]|nr:Holliday junction resolvase RuvX [Lachnospiraceae bacterium]
MKAIGLDFGAKTVGVALTDETGSIARPVEIIRRDHEKRLRRTLARIESIIEESHAELIVLGLPLNMDGSEGERTGKTKAFAEELQRRTGLSIIFQDERLSTVEAYEIMKMNGIRDREAQEKKIDGVAAAVILQDYCNGKRG